MSSSNVERSEWSSKYEYSENALIIGDFAKEFDDTEYFGDEETSEGKELNVQSFQHPKAQTPNAVQHPSNGDTQPLSPGMLLGEKTTEISDPVHSDSILSGKVSKSSAKIPTEPD
eukprot:868699_1